MSGKVDLVGGFLLAAALLFPSPAAAFATMPQAEVAKLVEARPESGNYLLVDVRPEIMYWAGHLPWAVSIPWPELENRADELPADSATTLVFYSGGAVRDDSAKAAEYAEKLGYGAVHVFAGGIAAWEESAVPWVATNYLKILINDRDKAAMIVDVRPLRHYLEGTLPGAVSIPWSEWDRLKGILPAEAATELIFFCGGLKCDLSHRAAAAAKALGYTRVKTYAYGWPDWKENATRVFAAVDPAELVAAAPAAPEEVLFEGEISREEFLDLVEKRPQGFLLVDVRPPEEFRAGRIPGAIHMRKEEIAENVDKLKGHDNVVFYCSTGSRCAAAYYAAEDAGVKGTRFLNRTVEIRPDGSFSLE